MKLKAIYLLLVVSIYGCGSESNADDEIVDDNQSSNLDLNVALYNGINITNENGFGYFKYIGGRAYDWGYSVLEGDRDISDVDGFDPHTIADNQMIFEDHYYLFDEPLVLEGKISNKEVMLYRGLVYCIDPDTVEETSCANYIDADAEFSMGALLYPYTVYDNVGPYYESNFINDVAINDIKRALLGHN